jgi:hypothetical protein
MDETNIQSPSLRHWKSWSSVATMQSYTHWMEVVWHLQQQVCPKLTPLMVMNSKLLQLDGMHTFNVLHVGKWDTMPISAYSNKVLHWHKQLQVFLKLGYCLTTNQRFISFATLHYCQTLNAQKMK